MLRKAYWRGTRKKVRAQRWERASKCHLWVIYSHINHKLNIYLHMTPNSASPSRETRSSSVYFASLLLFIERDSKTSDFCCLLVWLVSLMPHESNSSRSLFFATLGTFHSSSPNPRDSKRAGSAPGSGLYERTPPVFIPKDPNSFWKVGCRDPARLCGCTLKFLAAWTCHWNQWGTLRTKETYITHNSLSRVAKDWTNELRERPFRCLNRKL